jgi:hypothetical protein
VKIVPKNWALFQHYKDRCPPWIKIHRGLLNDRQFMCLPVASKALAPLLWLLASESKDGSFDASVDELVFRLRMTEKEISTGLKALIDNGFFLDASTMLAPSYQVAISERETEAETETEGEAETDSAKSAKKRASQLPENFLPRDSHLKLARDLGISLDVELPKFTDYHRAKGSTMKDWDAALRTWIRNARAFAKPEKLNAINRDFTKVDYHKGVNEDGSF